MASNKKYGNNARAILKRGAIQEIDTETWAASGGTAGVFGPLYAKGRLKIVQSDEPIIPKL